MNSPVIGTAVLDEPVDQDRDGGTRGLLAGATYAVLLVVVTLLSFGWLVMGAVVGAAAYVPAVTAGFSSAAAQGSRWAQGVLGAIPRSEPLGQAVLDYVLSLISIGVAAALLVYRGSSWSVRLLVLAMVGSAGAFNLQAHAADTAVYTATGLSVGSLHQILLHGVACAAYIVALLVFPPDRRTVAAAGFGRAVQVAAGVGTLLVVGFGTALLPHTISCVLFFGFLVPLAGLVVLPRRISAGTTATARAQARLLFSVLAVAFTITILLAIITLLLWLMDFSGLTIVDPTAHGRAEEPTGLLFWFSRLACIAIAAAVFLAMRPEGLWAAERLFSRGLAVALVTAVIGGGYVVVRTLIEEAIGDPVAAFTGSTLAVLPAALAFLPVYVRVERVVDRMLFGARPTPYSVLAGIAALSRAGATDAPDLERVAEAVGRGVGAITCRLTVVRPGLHDRAYTWVAPGAQASDELAEVAVRHGTEPIGTIAVDHTTVAGLQGPRRHLLQDIADSLGAVFQASRSGIELERQLRAALAHAAEIAASRRAVVAEMDTERRRIERDLHDGAQHHLVSLRLTLGLVEHQVSTGQFGPARGRLEQVAEQIDTAESILAETATGVSSPLLAERGLVGALRVELAGGHPPVTFDSEGVPADLPIPADVAAAVFFCCLESVNNARKHAGGAAIGVRLAPGDGRLRFTVYDEGPGWDPAARTGSPGRGMRNLMARIGSVGGRIEIRSQPGVGTVVEGSAPLPQPATELSTEAPAAAPTPAVAVAGLPLIDQVRDALRTARELYHGTPQAEPLRALAQRLDEPLRVAVSGPSGAGTSTLVEALRAAADCESGAELCVTLIDVPGREPSSGAAPQPGSDDELAPLADAFVLLLRRPPGKDGALPVLPEGPDPPRPALAIGVLARADEIAGADRIAADWCTRLEVRSLCHVVVPVAGLVARAATTLSDAEYRTLQEISEPAGDAGEVAAATGGPAAASSGSTSVSASSTASVPGTATGSVVHVVEGHEQLLQRFGPNGVRTAVDLIRCGRAPTSAALASELLDSSGVPRLLELIDSRFARRAEAVKARTALLALETLVRDQAPPSGGSALVYRLDRIRSGAHELTENDLVDALRCGALDLPDGERDVAERLLGATGAAPRARLGLPADAVPQEVARVAGEQLARWQGLAAHPMSVKDARDVAAVLVQTCEQLLARAARNDGRMGGTT
ncbi:sensor histidine kinase [Pseudonocardia alaniniphila]|uniref:Histidine kinase n=1 Tax=Pseudonocardia alaniniphila TaxID=75291 RepID=A0ABS9T7N1_9PSEU|nr:histidine kinase [Pseudonocardia alaniniphila]MCH6164453.1 histidine kinase [Pseudonocardia alaniniphila]